MREEEEASRLPYERLQLPGLPSPISLVLPKPSLPCRPSWWSLVGVTVNGMSVAAVALALATDEWVSLRHSPCAEVLEGGVERTVEALGVTLFYQTGRFKRTTEHAAGYSRTHWDFAVAGRHFRDCATPDISDLFHAVMAICFVELLCGLGAVAVEAAPQTAGAQREGTRGFLLWLSRNAIFSFFSGILGIIATLGGWLLVRRLGEIQTSLASPEALLSPEVTLGPGVLLLGLPPLLSLLGACVAGVRGTREMAAEEAAARSTQVARILTEQRRMETPRELEPGSTGPPPGMELFAGLPLPPPYAPELRAPAATAASNETSSASAGTSA